MTVGLCLITWNELEGCKHDIKLIDRSKFEQIYCIDGGSTDGTVAYLEEQGIEVYHQTSKGLNQACIDGANLCKCDAFVFYHPKGSIPVEDTYKFREYFDQGYELVVGSRMMKESVNEEDGKLIKPRKWFVLGLGVIAKILFKREGNTIWDTLHGFRGMTVQAFKKLGISNMDPSIDIEMVCRSYKFHIRRIEFPTKECARLAGETHFKAFATGKKLLKYIVWEIGRKDFAKGGGGILNEIFDFRSRSCRTIFCKPNTAVGRNFVFSFRKGVRSRWLMSICRGGSITV